MRDEKSYKVQAESVDGSIISSAVFRGKNAIEIMATVCMGAFGAKIISAHRVIVSEHKEGR